MKLRLAFSSAQFQLVKFWCFELDDRAKGMLANIAAYDLPAMMEALNRRSRSRRDIRCLRHSLKPTRGQDELLTHAYARIDDNSAVTTFSRAASTTRMRRKRRSWERATARFAAAKQELTEFQGAGAT